MTKDGQYLANVKAAEGPLQAVLNDLDEGLHEYVFNVFTNLVNTYDGVITACGILYLAFYFAGIMRGVIQPSVNAATIHIVKFILIFSVLQYWEDWTEELYLLFTNGPGQVISAITSSIGFRFQGTSNINAGADILAVKGFRTSTILFEKSGFTPLLMGAVVAGFTVVVVGYSALLIVSAKLVVAVLLGTTPIFMLFLLFENTRGFFEGWLRNLMTYIFIPILLYALLAVSLLLMERPLDAIQNDVNASALTFGSLLGFVFVAFITIGLIRQIKGIASSIGGGFVMGSMNLREYTSGSAHGITKTYNRWRAKKDQKKDN
ncbi:MAG: type IV secretion system protein [Gammaproteobacteria bacterium]|nr:type IV secretion system protein [Gammaproteobacteria bacterium]